MTDAQPFGNMTRFLPEELIFYQKASPIQSYRILDK